VRSINAHCEECGRPILWAKTDDGKDIPLDQSAPVYRAVPKDGGLAAVRDKGSFASHFAVCSRPDKFSKSKRTAIEDGEVPNRSSADLLLGVVVAARERVESFSRSSLGQDSVDQVVMDLTAILNSAPYRAALRAYEAEKGKG
jgi:hypothetical protein